MHMNRKVVLIVEDEVALITIYKKALEHAGYEVVSATTAEQALEIAANREGGIDLLLSDIVMGGMGGRELVWRFRKLHPNVPVILASGYTNEIGALQMIDQPNVVFVPKPIDLQILLGAIHDGLA